MDGAMSLLDLTGRVALISGAGGGIGLGVALALARCDVRIVALVRSRVSGENAVRLISEAGGVAGFVVGDVARPDSVGAAVEAAVERHGALDIVIHNAVARSSAEPLKLEDASDAEWAGQSAVALDGMFLLAQAALPHLRASTCARFVVLVSAGAMHGSVRNAVYPAVKGAQRGFVKALAREWGPHGITVNAVAPIAMSEGARRHFALHPEAMEPLLAHIPLRRLGDPETDVGAGIAAICTPAFGYVTGQTICVDGGAYPAL